MTHAVSRVWVFDAYGTLFDPAALTPLLDAWLPGRGAALAQAWRETQLRYTWLRTLLGRWAPFDSVTADALRYTLRSAGVEPDGRFIDEALAAYQTLPPYPEVRDVLQELDGRAVLLSNGTRTMLESATRAAGLAARFAAILSSDDVAVYKPDPRIYGLVGEELGIAPRDVRFVSGNGWDCAGAAAVGFEVIRIARTASPGDELGVPPPARTLRDLHGLLDSR
ncbi:MAG: haloacid dehalogenase type II [Chloroflexota bacterium]|nr:haloacid dehalogenase type II [Chloroflexota bacterium]